MKREGWELSSSVDEIKYENKARVYKEVEKIKWESHPLSDQIKLRYLLTNKEDDVEVTCMLGKVPKGEVVPEHTHNVYDILFPLSGKAKIWIKGIGDLELKRGVLVSVPPGIPHKIYDVTEDLEVFDIFSSAII